ncbi:MAG: EAL domain-containing response regulator [Myxococcales bacterium]|nr:EAL domain-containing response regulator [Myxococcales bacterium]
MVASPLSFPPASQPAPRVLLLDDDSLVLRSLTRALSACNLQVTATDDPYKAMRLVDSETFDAVLCDIRMPQMNGLAFARYVRAQRPELPILLMTGDPQLESALEAIEVGILEYLSKPIEPARVRSAVGRAVKLSRFARLRREAQDMVASEPPPSRADTLNAALTRALATLHVAFQPIVSPQDRSIFGYEALLRSREPELPSPPAVIEAAEITGRTDEVGAAVRACASAAFARAPKDAHLFLNIVPLDLMAEELYDPRSHIGALADRIVLEVTERAELGKVKDALPRIQRLRAQGYRIAVDDLGAGYAGLSSFAALEPEFTKLDMSLVRGAHTSSVKQRVVGSIVSLCRELGSVVVAEGIETTEDRLTLASLGCELMQGYFFAKPAPAFPDVFWG